MPFRDSSAIPTLGILPSFRSMCRCYMNTFAQVGAYRSRPAEALQKGAGGWTAFCYPPLPYFISPFAKRPQNSKNL
jgi:hypothetical protein